MHKMSSSRLLVHQTKLTYVFDLTNILGCQCKSNSNICQFQTDLTQARKQKIAKNKALALTCQQWSISSRHALLQTKHCYKQSTKANDCAVIKENSTQLEYVQCNIQYIFKWKAVKYIYYCIPTYDSLYQSVGTGQLKL